MNELALKPQDLYRTGTDVAGICKEFVVNSSIHIKGRKFVKVEGWQSIAAAHGCIAEIESVKEIEIQGINGIEAWAVLRRMSDSSVISRASGFVGQDEAQWPARNVYARYAMAQTRATSRVCRNAFAWVVLSMNAGLETTPAEEVPPGGFEDAKPVQEQLTAMQQAQGTKQFDNSSTQFTVTDDTRTGVLGELKTSKDGKSWFVSVGEFGKYGSGNTIWTKDVHLATDIAIHKGKKVTVHLEAKQKPGSYQLISFIPD